MLYKIHVRRKGERSELIYKGPNSGYAWKLFLQYKAELQPEDKVSIKEKCGSNKCGWKVLRTYTQYY